MSSNQKFVEQIMEHPLEVILCGPDTYIIGRHEKMFVIQCGVKKIDNNYIQYKCTSYDD